MNNLFKKSLTLFTLTVLISAPVSVQAADELDYTNAYELMKDFLDLTIKKDKPMNYWVKQFMGLIKQKGDDKIQSLAPFLREFNTALRSRQPALIGLAFKNHKEKFGEPELTEYIKGKINQPNGLNTLTSILKARLNQ